MSKKKRKVSKRLRAQILRNPSKVNKKDLSPEALTYLKRVQAAANARAVKASRYIQVGSLLIPKNSDAYRQLEALSRQDNLTVEQFLKDRPERHEKFLREYRDYYETHLEKLEIQLENFQIQV